MELTGLVLAVVLIVAMRKFLRYVSTHATGRDVSDVMPDPGLAERF